MRRESVSPFDYLKRGLYNDSIVMAKKHFKVDEILILCLESFTSNIKALNEVCLFLDIDPYNFSAFPITL